MTEADLSQTEGIQEKASLEVQKISIDDAVSKYNNLPIGIDQIASDLIANYHSTTRRGGPEGVAESTVKELSKLIFSIPYYVNSKFKLYRSRPTQNKIAHFKDRTAFRYPPHKFASLGRANKAGSAVLYASHTDVAAFEEIKAKTPNLKFFNTCVIRPKMGQQSLIMVIGEIDYLRRHQQPLFAATNIESMNKVIEKLRDDVRRAIFLTDAFFAEEFRKPHTEAIKQHILTATISEMLFSDPKIDGIVYPSVAYSGGFNIAIRPSAFDEKYTIDAYYSSEVSRDLGYGIIELIRYSQAYETNEQGRILWIPAEGEQFIEFLDDSGAVEERALIVIG